MANPLVCVFNPVTSFIDEIQSVSSGPASNGIPIVTNLLGVIDTSLLGIGSIATAGQSLSAGNLVNLYSFAGTLHAQIASAQNGGGSPPAGPYPLQAQGFAAASATVGAPLTISFFGTFKYIDGNSEFNAGSIGAEVYLSDRGDGSPTLTPPSGGGELEQSVGYVVAFASPNVVTINFASGFQDFTHISGVNPITKGGTGATTSAQALINLINNAATTGQALVFNGTNWVPGSAVTPFTDITSGTNTTAAMVVGTGASLSASGSGTIAATSVPFSGLTTSANVTATLTVGTGGTLTFSGSGVVNANQISGTAVSGTTGTGNVVFATSPTISGATMSGAITISGTETYTTANPTFFSQTGTGAVVLATSPTISGSTLSGTITISGTATYTTANPTFFSQTGTGAVVLGTSPTISGATLSGTITTSGTETYTTANPTFFAQTGTGSVVLATSPSIASPTLTGEAIINRLKTTNPDVAGIVAFAGSSTATYTFASPYTGTNPPLVIGLSQFDPTGSNPALWVSYTGSAGAWTAFTFNFPNSQTGSVNYLVIDIG